MKDRVLIRAGAVGVVIAAMCCATPALAVLLPLVGLSAWLARPDYVLFPLPVASLGLIALGLYRRRTTAAAHCDTEPAKKGVK